MSKKLTVCGGGNAAHVLIALGGHAGWEVDVFTPLVDEVRRLSDGIRIQGGITATVNGQTITACPRRVSADPADVIPGSELILLALPAFAHGTILEAIADYIDPHTGIGTLPARGGFDYQARDVLDIDGRSLTIFGLQTLPWACRIGEYGRTVEILGTKKTVILATSPSENLSYIIDRLAFIPDVEFSGVGSYLALTLANTGQIIHPGIMYGLCQGKENDTFTAPDIPLFYQNVNTSTANILEALSCEIQKIAAALAEKIPGFRQEDVIPLDAWLIRAYPDDIQDASTLERAFVTNCAYHGLRIPVRATGDSDVFTIDFQARYLSEDVPFGLVVSRGIAELAGVKTPVIDEVIAWAQERLGQVFLENGRLTGADVARTRAPQTYGIHSLEQLIEVT